ncbi:unnamed protein product [Sphagnum jensenii]|uniref:Uncharacterized protein n=1 Tax=Sphagnum jensenii TaxID=128206 RepID=A0ABP0X7I6_9BRYO
MTSRNILAKLINATNIDRLDIPVGWTQESLQKQHFMFVNQFIWNKIICLAETIAAPIVLKKQQMAGSTPAGRLERLAKRIKTLELLSAALDIVADDDKKDVNGSGECFKTVAQMVNAEVQILKGIGDETNIELWPESAELCKWWARQTSMPCLMQAALAILANKPSSGGLECDLGSLSDVMAPKRSSLCAGLVEINMFLKINKHLIPTNLTEVVLLDNSLVFPAHYHKLALFNFGIVAGSLTSNSFVKSLTSVSAAIGIFTHGGMDTSCAECCGKPVAITSLELNTSADATVAMQTSIWSVEDDHFLIKNRGLHLLEENLGSLNPIADPEAHVGAIMVS